MIYFTPSMDTVPREHLKYAEAPSAQRTVHQAVLQSGASQGLSPFFLFITVNKCTHGPLVQHEEASEPLALDGVAKPRSDPALLFPQEPIIPHPQDDRVCGA